MGKFLDIIPWIVGHFYGLQIYLQIIRGCGRYVYIQEEILAIISGPESLIEYLVRTSL